MILFYPRAIVIYQNPGFPKGEAVSLKILIVDDLKSMREEFASVCRLFLPDALIDEAEDVPRAMELLQKQAPPYDAVFTDINMPDISGLKLITAIRELSPYKTVPLIVISALTGRQDVERAIQLGANGYLLRPLQKDDFEIIFTAYLQPLLQRQRSGSHRIPK